MNYGTSGNKKATTKHVVELTLLELLEIEGALYSYSAAYLPEWCSAIQTINKAIDSADGRPNTVKV